jgi:hypothetical protein
MFYQTVLLTVCAYAIHLQIFCPYSPLGGMRKLLKVEKYLPHQVIHYHQNEIKSVRITSLLASK